jgi:DtxR family transcriptional regulator, Mn-dependent transcriptional regulator
MTDSVELLTIVVLLVMASVFVMLPRYGMMARWTRARRDAKRIMIEDALKHIQDCDYTGATCTIRSIAGALSIPIDESASLIARLAQMGLLVSTDRGVKLTPEGNSYALRVVRVHRLWEKYLADETSVPPSEWHAVAEAQEHRITPKEADALAAQLGNPLYDPHGDPIPTASGEIPPRTGTSLLSLRPGEWAAITHIEDEPKAVFAQLSAEGLYAGMHIRMIESTDQRVRFAADGEEIILAPVMADNLTVEPLATEMTPDAPMETLASADIGEDVRVVSISKACRGQQRRRLLDLGIVPGTEVRAELRSVSGDPTAYRVRGALVALRKQHAQMIFIQRS